MKKTITKFLSILGVTLAMLVSVTPVFAEGSDSLAKPVIVQDATTGVVTIKSSGNAYPEGTKIYYQLGQTQGSEPTQNDNNLYTSELPLNKIFTQAQIDSNETVTMHINAVAVSADGSKKSEVGYLEAYSGLTVTVGWNTNDEYDASAGDFKIENISKYTGPVTYDVTAPESPGVFKNWSYGGSDFTNEYNGDVDGNVDGKAISNLNNTSTSFTIVKMDSVNYGRWIVSFNANYGAATKDELTSKVAEANDILNDKAASYSYVKSTLATLKTATVNAQKALDDSSTADYTPSYKAVDSAINGLESAEGNTNVYVYDFGSLDDINGIYKSGETISIKAKGKDKFIFSHWYITVDNKSTEVKGETLNYTIPSGAAFISIYANYDKDLNGVDVSELDEEYSKFWEYMDNYKDLKKNYPETYKAALGDDFSGYYAVAESVAEEILFGDADVTEASVKKAYEDLKAAREKFEAAMKSEKATAEAEAKKSKTAKTADDNNLLGYGAGLLLAIAGIEVAYIIRKKSVVE